MKKLICALSLLLCSAASADVLCIKGETITTKKKCAKNEVKASLSNFVFAGAAGLPGAQGPQGVQGPQGPAGASITNLNLCARRIGEASGSGLLVVTAMCLTDEFLVTHGVHTSETSFIDSIALEKAVNGTLGEVPGGVSYFVRSGEFFTATVQAFCCKGARF